MSDFSIIATALHIFAAAVWVGGMFFTHFALRPSLPVPNPPGPDPLRLWCQVLARFFVLVWIAITTILATGYSIVYVDYGSFKETPLHVDIMHGIGLLMIGIFIFLYSQPYRRMSEAVAKEDWPKAALHQSRLRRIVVVNMCLGLTMIAVGATGRIWG